MRSVLVGVAVVLTGLLAAAFVWRGLLAMMVMERAALATFAGDPIAELPDGLHVALCGAGGPLADPVRSGPCVAVIAGRQLFVVDAGSGGARNLVRMGFSPGRVAAVFVTHFHSDHIDGLGELALQRWTNAAREAPLPVYGPEGVGEVVNGFNAAYRQDAGYRTTHHGEAVAPSSGAGLVAAAFTQPAMGESRVLLERDGVTVSVFRVEHEPVAPAVGYRFDYGGRSAVVSGDTKKSANLERFSNDVDVLAHEALAPQIVAILNRAATATGRTNIAKITDDIPSYHTSPVEAAEIAEAANVGHLLLYHVVPALLVPGLDAAFMDGVHDAYAGPITLGRDGTMLSMPSGSSTIDLSARL